MNPDLLLTTSLRAAPWGAPVTRIMAAALQAVDPAGAVHRYLHRDGELLHAGEQTYDLTRYERVFVVGTGKAGAPMARAAAEILGGRLAGGVVVVKGYGAERGTAEGAEGAEGSEISRTTDDRQPTTDEGNPKSGALGRIQNPKSKIQNPKSEDDGQTAHPLTRSPAHPLTLVEAGHPVPDERGVAGARQVAQLLAQATERDLTIVLISGGGSALLTLPAEGISLAEMQALTSTLLRCGANINEINALRKHLDQVKGGGLARLAHPATLVTLILSDVVGNPLDVIASGPTVPDTSSFEEAYAVLERYGVVAQAPAAIVARLRGGMAGTIAETPKPGDPRFDKVQNLLVGSNSQAAEAALAAARAEGFNTLLLTTYLQAEARAAGRVLAAVARELAATGRPLPRPACMVAGGETTVTLRGDGLGGRNQELALAAIADMAGLADTALIALATDGGDGPTDAAGAVVTGATLARARELGLDPAAHLARNDAYPFFAALGDLLRPGPTETNVNDLAFVFAF